MFSQEDTAYTSVNQVPAAFKVVSLKGTNLDFGGGKFDTATKFLKDRGVKNLVFDPFNRPFRHNADVLASIRTKNLNSITCLNVLNVLQDDSDIVCILAEIKGLAEEYKVDTLIFQVFEGNRSGILSETTAQRNQKAVDYVPVIQRQFTDWEMTRHGSKKNIFQLIRKKT